MAAPANTGSRAVRVAKPGVAAKDTVSAFADPGPAYGPAPTYKQTAWKNPNSGTKKAAPRPTYGTYGSGSAVPSQTGNMHRLTAYNAYGQPYTAPPSLHSQMVGSRPSYVDPATGMTRTRFVGNDPAYSNMAVARYTFMGQAPGSPMSFVGGY